MSSEKNERIVATALAVFSRHGYKKVTMSDLAEAAAMSRPALYLVFDSKEAVFRATLLRYFEATMAELQAEMPATKDVAQRVMFAMEVFCVRPFEMTITHPDTKDLLESGYAFANDIVTASFERFEALLARLLEPAMPGKGNAKVTAGQVAHLLVSGAIGFKQASSTAAELREMISLQLTLMLGGLR